MNIPLAERLRPKSLDDYIGQKHLVGPDGVVRRMIESGRIASFILWGPPGVGKTTLARIIANTVNVPYYTLSAVNSGVKDVRDVLDKCKRDAASMFTTGRPVLFIDEIHRFNKAQQDSLLGAVESGIVTLIGATTENPSFEVIRPLLSRAQVYTLRPLEGEELDELLARAIEKDDVLRAHGVEVEQTTALFRFGGGDARKLLNILDLLEQSTPQGEKIVINDRVITDRLQENPAAYDKGGEMHYDIISAFIKSIRGSDPDAAVYWLARMIEGGEEPEFIARRLLILAAEDVGLANPNALLLAEAGCFGIVLEKIPAVLAGRVAEAVKIPIIGIGAGNRVDGQVLVSYDMLGINNGFSPRFLRRYLNLHEQITAAVEQYREDVKSGDFPNDGEQY